MSATSLRASAARLEAEHRDGAGRPHLVTAAAAVALAAQLAFRAWTLFPSWFFLDDYNLLHDARDHGLATLGSPYNSHLMPGGRLLTWLVQTSGPVDWTLAAALVLALQLAVGVTGWWMLVRLFEPRWWLLVPYLVLLTTPLAFPSTMWWAAAVNLVPVEAAFFAAVGAWVTYLRSGRRRWLGLTAVAVLVGLAFDVKGVLAVPVLLYAQQAWFATGSARDRLRALRHTALGPAVLVALLVGYAAYYLAAVPQITGATSAHTVADVTESMLGTAFPTAVLGGPWRWDDLAPPTAYADPPGWATSLSWVVLAAVVGYAWLRRVRTVRAWVLVLGYLVVLVLLLATSRASTFGGVLGLELRYLTDAVDVVVLALPLAFLELPGAPGSSAPRAAPLLARPLPAYVAPALVVVVAAGGLWSSARYATYWHDDNASDPYLHTLQEDLDHTGRVDLADQQVPDEVLSHLAAPHNTTRRLAELLGDQARFPEATGDLVVVGSDGGLRRAVVVPGVTSQTGPVAGCGWAVRSGGLDVPLEGRAFQWTWWVQVGYLASADSPVTLTAGDSTVTTAVQKGIGNLWVRVSGTFDHVRLTGLAPGTTLCVDTVVVGQPQPGGTLP